MELSMAERSNTCESKGAAVIGSNLVAVQAALTLARMGVEVKLLTNSTSFSWDSSPGSAQNNYPLDGRYFRPLLLRAASHPLITLYSNVTVDDIEGEKGNFRIRARQQPRYINEELCTACGRCEAECSVKL